MYGVFLLGSLVVLFLAVLVTKNFCTFSKTILHVSQDVLLVIAHPDDECMFFGPTIINLLKHGKSVSILCLSNGDYRGAGNQREQELIESCQILGVGKDKVHFARDPLLKDDPNTVWSSERISSIVADFAKKLHVDTIVTFDAFGVSGHANHIAIHEALESHYSMLARLRCRVYLLQSVGFLRKYLWHIDIFICSLFSDNALLASYDERHTIQKAMVAHASQYVWFRKQYFLYSRYVILNVLSEMEPEKVE